MNKIKEFTEMIGKTMVEADGYTFKDTENNLYNFFHSQSCCEFVDILDVDGDFNDLIGSPILVAEEVSDAEFECSKKCEELSEIHQDVETDWYFYKFATIKGTVIVRWYGGDNGYYGHEVDFTVNGEFVD